MRCGRENADREKGNCKRVRARVATNYRRRAQFYPASVEKGLLGAGNSPHTHSRPTGRYPASVGVTTLLHSLILAHTEIHHSARWIHDSATNALSLSLSLSPFLWRASDFSRLAIDMIDKETPVSGVCVQSIRLRRANTPKWRRQTPS